MSPVNADRPSYGEEKCIDCGKCTYSCPVSRMRDFSPRDIVARAQLEGRVPRDRGIWQCMNCGMCTQVCQNGVRFHVYVRSLRPELSRSLRPERNHGAMPDEIMRLNSVPGIRPRKQGWLTKELETSEGSDTLLFVGCTPYFDVIFRYLDLQMNAIPRAAVSLLNRMGERPKLLREERCCGHDAYWSGEDELFEKLVRLNMEQLDKAKVKEVLAFCPECMSTLRDLYPKVVGPLGFKVRSLSERIAEAINEGELEASDSDEKLTFHDPCRLGRHSGVYEEPRSVLKAVGELEEMPRSKELGPCCGVSAWMECGSDTRPWQLERLREASETVASRMVTACPKCLIHFTCAMSERTPLLPRAKLPLVDLHVLADERLRSRKAK